MKGKIFILSLIFILINLSYQNQIFLRHSQQTRYNDTAYANQMLKRQQQFDNKMKAIQQQVRALDQNISKYEGNDTYQIMKLQQGLADQRDSLYDVQKSLNQPFALKPCQKPNLTDEQKTKLNNQIKTTNQSLKSMRLQVKKCTEQPIQTCSVPDQLIHQITRAQLYLAVMNDYVNGNCTRVPRTIASEQASGLVDLNNRLFKDNLKAPNWIYGNITQQQYRLIVFSETTKFNMTTCPIETPFANKINNTCFNCPQGSIFSLGQRICTCKSGFKFDQSTNQCVSLTPIKPCNQTGTCVSMCPKDKPKWNSVNKLCESCPSDKPIVNRSSNTCQSCPQQKPLWNQVTYQCQTCPLNTHYVQNLSKCVPCKDDQKYNQSIRKCVPICKSYQVYNKQQGKCYSLQELNGCKCNQRYNQNTKQCQEACDNGLQWLSSQKKCGPPALPEFKDNCKYYQRLNKQTNQCQNYCDSTVAWYDRQNHVCIKIGCSVQCKCGQIFDNLTGKCIPQSHQCPQKQFYNTTSKQCQLYCPQNLVYNSATNKCQTPAINCPQDQRYDNNEKKCLKKCTGNSQVYNSNSQKCQCLYGYTFDATGTNCISIQSTCLASLFQKYSPQKRICQCIDGYHLDLTTKLCVKNPIQCNLNLKMIYSKQYNKCVCTEGFTMNDQNSCVSVCHEQSNMIYSFVSKICVCKPDHYLSPDGKYCLHLSSRCLSANNMVYSQGSKSCQCLGGYYMSADQSTCISIASTCLSSNNQHYDPYTASCACNQGYKFNQTDSKCYSDAIVCNQALHFILNPQTKQCECILGYKLSADRTYCISLAQICLKNANTIFNAVSSKCQCLPGYSLKNQSGDSIVCSPQCKQDQSYNQNTRECVKLCPFDYYYNTTTHSCIYRCQPQYQYNNATQQCQHLVKTCPDPINQFYDSKTNQCHYCPAGYILNRNSLMCQKKTITCAQGQFYDQSTSTCKYCRQGQVYNVLKKVCQFITTTCSSGMYFDFSLGQCRSCTNGYVYDDSLLQCRAACTLDQVFDYGKKICVQIASTCNSYQYYDKLTRKCVNKPICSSLQRYDDAQRKCIDLNYITSKNANNLIHSNFTSYQQFYDSRKATDSYLVDCPSTTPFYSSQIKNCVYCPITHPYFNLETQKCQDCGNDKYDLVKRICINLSQPTNSTATQPVIDYSLDRLVMNII